MLAFVAFVGLAVDGARVRVVKRQLQEAADAAARYAAVGLSANSATARNNAVAAAADNTADGTAVQIDRNSDVELGVYDTTAHTFTPGGAASSFNAVRVTARRTTAAGNAVPLIFGKAIGQPTCDVTASAVAAAVDPAPAGMVGYNGIDLHNSNFIGSYHSSILLQPTQGSGAPNAKVGTNVTLNGHNGTSLKGDVLLGPGATVSGVTVWGNQLSQPAPLALPAMPAWAPKSNPGGIPSAYTAANGTILPGGSYYFTSLTLSGTLTFSGPATLYVNGDVSIGGTLAASGTVPANLRVYQYGSHQFIAGGNNVTVVADVLAPLSNFTSQNNLSYYGRGIFNSITVNNGSEWYVDEDLPKLVATVK